jgi:hypothetical protein
VGILATPAAATVLFCLACGNEEVCARGLCRSCYDSAYHDDSYFAGAKANELARDGHRCRACGDPTNVVHHRRPGCDQEKWLITLCPACHATVERLEREDRYLPPLLFALWREQHRKPENNGLGNRHFVGGSPVVTSKQPEGQSRNDER